MPYASHDGQDVVISSWGHTLMLTLPCERGICLASLPSDRKVVSQKNSCSQKSKPQGAKSLQPSAAFCFIVEQHKHFQNIPEQEMKFLPFSNLKSQPLPPSLLEFSLVGPSHRPKLSCRTSCRTSVSPTRPPPLTSYVRLSSPDILPALLAHLPPAFNPTPHPHLPNTVIIRVVNRCSGVAPPPSADR